MKKKMVSEVATQIRGVSYKPTDLHDYIDEDSVILLRANNIDNGQLNFDNVLFVDKSKVAELQYLQKGDILICASSGSIDLVGKSVQINIDGEFTFGAFCKAIRPTGINSDYFAAFFQSSYYRRTIAALAQGININNIKKGHIDTLLINCPTEEQQNEVVSIINRVSRIIQNRKKQLALLDTLIKARFVELFIDKGYPTKTVDEVSLTQGEYGAQSAAIAYDPARPRYVRITDINDDGTLNNDVVASINPDDDEQYRLAYGDFMFARVGATVGKTYAFIQGNQIFAGYLIRYRLNQQIINPRYLFWYTKLDEYWNWVKVNQSGAAQPGINAKKYGSLRIPVPPLDKQNQFAAFVAHIDKSKAVVQKALDETQLLFDSLMQKYFG